MLFAKKMYSDDYDQVSNHFSIFLTPNLKYITMCCRFEAPKLYSHTVFPNHMLRVKQSHFHHDFTADIEQPILFRFCLVFV